MSGNSTEEFCFDSSTYPGGLAPSQNNLIDDDCDGLVDEGYIFPSQYTTPQCFNGGELAISEIMYNDSVQWFEVYNTTLYSINMMGMMIRDMELVAHGSEPATFFVSEHVVVPPHGYAVFCTDASIFTAAHCDYTYGYNNLVSALGDATTFPAYSSGLDFDFPFDAFGVDGLRLSISGYSDSRSEMSTVILDEVTWSSSDPLIVTQEHYSVEVLPSIIASGSLASDNDSSASWQAGSDCFFSRDGDDICSIDEFYFDACKWGTPGGPNSPQ